VRETVPTGRQASGAPARARRALSPRLVILCVGLTASGLLCVALAADSLTARKSIQPPLALTIGARPATAGSSTPFGIRGSDDMTTIRQHLARPPSPSQDEGYEANRGKSVVELQRYRELTRLTVDGFAGSRAVASLIDLSPQIGTWYLLRLETPNGPSATYHLENPSAARLRLDPTYLSGIVIEPGGSRARSLCELWPAGKATPLADARASGVAFAPLCGGQLYLRNPVEGHRTPKEHVVDLLRDHVWQGEQITVLVRDLFFRDAYLATSSLVVAPVKPPAQSSSGPVPPLVDPAAFDRLLVPVNLELGLDDEAAGRVAVGRWYRAKENPGIFVTTLRPDLVSSQVIAEQKGRVAALDPIESAALVYLVAFDLKQFDLGFRVGTDHPRVGWSDMVVPAVRDDALAGPDGIETIEPLVRTGILSPMERSRVAATFTGGFKRAHGAFRMSQLAVIDHGSHYGFVDNGVVLSKLQPGLATVVVFADGSVDLKTWNKQDDSDLPRIRYARQNGVPILERDLGSRQIVPGARVREWGPGNWSGSADKRLRTLRAGLCLQESPGQQFLVYGYFSSATPSSMARVFRASGCRYAMLLDMNALEHTYLALYRTQGSRLLTQHLIDGMGVVDGSRDGQPLPRFVSIADNRDFFYLLRRSPR
jgi:hypothetical protein